MFKLISKEMRLAAHPTLFAFMLLGALIIIPSYPYSIVFLFGCLGPFISFYYSRETNDTFYTATLPLRKRDVVKGKCLMVIISQMCMLLISVPFAILRVYILPDGNPLGMEANVLFYAFGLLYFAVFNVVFLITYYKTAYKVGKAFLAAIIPAFIVGIAMEALAYIPATKWLDSTAPALMVQQLPLLGIGLVVYIGTMLIAYQISALRFERVDL